LRRTLSDDGGSREIVPDDDPRWSPLFRAVDLFAKDVKKWGLVHEGFRKMIMERYADYPELAKDPPIRYFVIKSCEWPRDPIRD